MSTTPDRPLTPPGYVLLSDADYQRLLDSACLDDMIVICEMCGAWIYRDEPECCTGQDFHGCWKMATGGKFDECVSHRAPNKLP